MHSAFLSSESRSYGRRHRRLSAAQKTLLAATLERFRLRPGDSLDAVFGRKRPVWLEIGFGKGEHLHALAQAHPEVNLIGCEPYINGVVGLLRQLRSDDAVRIVPESVFTLLPHLPEASVERVFLLHPDPWPKRKHWSRRIVRQSLLDGLARVCTCDARWFIVTDSAPYHAWIDNVFRRDSHWAAHSLDGASGVLCTQTRYARKAQAAGARSYARLFLRVPRTSATTGAAATTAATNEQAHSVTT